MLTNSANASRSVCLPPFSLFLSTHFSFSVSLLLHLLRASYALLRAPSPGPAAPRPNQPHTTSPQPPRRGNLSFSASAALYLGPLRFSRSTHRPTKPLVPAPTHPTEPSTPPPRLAAPALSPLPACTFPSFSAAALRSPRSCVCFLRELQSLYLLPPRHAAFSLLRSLAATSPCHRSGAESVANDTQRYAVVFRTTLVVGVRRWSVGFGNGAFRYSVKWSLDAA